MAGNNITRKKIKYSVNNDKKLFKSIKIFFNKKLYTNKKIKVNKKSTIPIFIVGMPRSGTTLIEQILSNHTKVFGAGETEILDKLINKYAILNKKKKLSKNFLIKCGNLYISELEKISNNSKYIIDKLPFNFRWLGFIKLILPNAKIIHCIRNSKDTCMSIFKNYFPYRSLGFAYSIDEIINYYESYRDLMKHWGNLFNEVNIHNIKYENLINSPEDEIKKILKFIDLDWENNCMNFHENKRAVFTASDIQVRKPIYQSSINSWTNYKKYLPEKFLNLKD